MTEPKPEVPPVEFRDPIADPDLPWVTGPDRADPVPPETRLDEEPHEVTAEEDDG